MQKRNVFLAIATIFITITLYAELHHSSLSYKDGVLNISIEEIVCILSEIGVWLALCISIWNNDKLRKSNIHLKERVERLASRAKKATSQLNIDELTGLLNRNGLLEWRKVNKRIEQYQEIEYSISFLDIDHFKRVNDNYGHKMGDEILKQFSELLQSEMDNFDFIGRIGGEEFVCISIGDQENAVKIAKRLQSKMKTIEWKHQENLTCSIGISSKKESFEKTMKAADFAMYESKNNGRNQITLSSNIFKNKGKLIVIKN